MWTTREAGVGRGLPGSLQSARRSEDRPRALDQEDDHDDDPDEDAEDEPAHSQRVDVDAPLGNSTPAILACSFVASLGGAWFTMRKVDIEPARGEVFVSVDIEASGPSPSTGSLISLGACLVDDPRIGVYLELKPIPNLPWNDDAAAIHGLDRRALERDGLEPADAMDGLATWLLERCGPDARPIFVGFNAPFDWMFVADYFWRFLGRNPFGISALDLKSLFMARAGVTRWGETTRTYVDRWLGLDGDHNHHALDDARGQARVARILLGIDAKRSRPGVEI